MNYYNFIFTLASGKVKSQVIWNHSLSLLYVLLIYYELKVTPLLIDSSEHDALALPYIAGGFLGCFSVCSRDTRGRGQWRNDGGGGEEEKENNPAPSPIVFILDLGSAFAWMYLLLT